MSTAQPAAGPPSSGAQPAGGREPGDMETLLVEASRQDNEIMRTLIQAIDPDQPC